MSSLIEQLVEWLVPFLCGGAITVLGLMWRWGRAITNGLRDHDGIADDDLKSRSQRLYNSYHSLGGNGHGTSLNDDIQSAPIAPRNRT